MSSFFTSNNDIKMSNYNSKKHPRINLEIRNPELMEAYDRKTILGRALFRYFNGMELNESQIESISSATDSEKLAAYSDYCQSVFTYQKGEELGNFLRNSRLIRRLK